MVGLDKQHSNSETTSNSRTRDERDFIDMSSEMLGEDTGRIKRFALKTDTSYSLQSDKKKCEERQYQSMLAYLLSEDAQYRKLYFEVEAKLESALEAVEQAKLAVEQDLRHANANLKAIRDEAARTEDGTLVFEANNGALVSEDGLRMDNIMPEQVEGEITRFEDYQDAKETVSNLAQELSEIEDFKEKVVIAKQHHSNASSPPDMDELRHIDEMLSAQMPARVAAFRNANALSHQRSEDAEKEYNQKDFSPIDLSATFMNAFNNTPDAQTPEIEHNSSEALSSLKI